MVSELASIAEQSDRQVADARAELVRAVRAASRSGMTQQQIAREIGRSQPEVSRLLRFHGRTPLGRRLRRHAGEIHAVIQNAGGDHVRVFGSAATGNDGELSDVDLIFTPSRALSLLELGALERRLAGILGTSVDLVPDTSLRPDLRERILAEAVAL